MENLLLAGIFTLCLCLLAAVLRLSGKQKAVEERVGELERIRDVEEGVRASVERISEVSGLVRVIPETLADASRRMDSMSKGLAELSERLGSALKVLDGIQDMSSSTRGTLDTLKGSLRTLSDITQELKSINEGIRDISKTLGETVNAVGDVQSISTGARSTLDTLSGSVSEMSGKVRAIQERVSNIDVKVEDIKDIKEKVERIHEALVGKRGESGEKLLHFILRSLLGEDEYELQKTVDGYRPDALVRKRIEGMERPVEIVIDAKATGMSNDPRRLCEDVRRRIEEAAKYSRGDRLTVMFVPSDEIYTKIVSDMGIISFAMRKRVIIAGPTALWSLLLNLDILKLIRDMQERYGTLQRQAHELCSTLEAFEKSLDTSIRHLENHLKKLAELKDQVGRLKGILSGKFRLEKAVH